MANYGYDPDRFRRQGFGYPMSDWELIPEGWQENMGAGGIPGGGIANLANEAGSGSMPALGWGQFAAGKGLDLAGKAISYMFGGQRKEQKAAKADYTKDRTRIEAGMNESPYNLAEFNTFATRGMHNYRSTVAKQIADIADINATDVQGAMAEQGAIQGQNSLMDAFLNARMARFNNRADSRRALLQASLQRYLTAQG